MGNWWLDESPYAGPDQEPPLTWDDIKGIWGSYSSAIVNVGRRLSVGITTVWTSYVDEVNAAKEALQQVYEAYGEPEYGPTGFHPSMTYEERRKHALRCAQNRNTGPRSEWSYHRDGRRLH